MQPSNHHLDPLPIPLRFRCPKRWAELEGTGARRLCTDCDLHVHDLSSMTAVRAERFLAARDDRTCIAYRCRPDGRVVFARPAPRWTAVTRWLGHVGAWLALCLPFLGCRKAASVPPPADAGVSDGEVVHDVELLGTPPPAGNAREELQATDQPLELLELIGY